MWNAVIDSKATAGGIQDKYGLPPRGVPENEQNLISVGVPLLKAATHDEVLKYELADGQSGDVPVKLGTITANHFRELFNGLVWHDQYDEVIGPFAKFLDRATSDGRISEWVVVWPQPQKSAGTLELPGVGAAPVIKRNRRNGGRIDFVGSDRKHANAALPFARGKAAGDLPAANGRGVVLIYLADDREDPPTAPLSTNNVVPLLSIAVPDSATPHKRDLIQWTVRVQGKDDDAAVEASTLSPTG
jgi:hypothetical protein